MRVGYRLEHCIVSTVVAVICFKGTKNPLLSAAMHQMFPYLAEASISPPLPLGRRKHMPCLATSALESWIMGNNMESGLKY